MRYHSPRVVLGACLLAATAAAQAHVSSFGSANGPDRSYERVGTFGEPSLYEPGANLQDPQAVDYSLRAMFLREHGEFMNLRERHREQVEVRARVLPNQRINHEPGSFDMLGYDFDATLPALVSTDGYLTFGAYYKGRRYLTSSAFGTAGNGAGNGIGDETLIGAGVKLGFGVFLDDNVLLEMETHPGAWSDLDDGLHHEDFDFPSFGLFTFRAVDNFFFKLGARYNQVYEEAPWLPMLGFSWEVVDGFRIDILAPESLELSWWPDSSFGILFGAEATGAEYHVHTSEAVNQRDDVRVQEIIAYLGFVSRFSDHASLRARGGIVVAGDYDMTTGAAGFNRSEGALDQGAFAEISIGFSF